MIRLLRPLILVVFFSMASVVMYAQPGDGGGDPDVPISGIEILIALGGFFGARKIINSRKRNSSTNK